MCVQCVVVFSKSEFLVSKTLLEKKGLYRYSKHSYTLLVHKIYQYVLQLTSQITLHLKVD